MQLQKLGPDSQGNQWVRAFLLNFKPNDQGWFVSKDTANKNILTAVDKPLVLHKQREKLDHPEWSSLKSIEANIAEQTKKAIGVIKRVLWNEPDESYYADVKITDPAANEFLSSYEKNNLSIPTSPQLIYDGRKQKPTDLKDWFVSHLAVVSKGAFGPNAKVIDSCISNANDDEKPCFAEPIQGSSKFDFCVKSALNSAVVGSSLQNSDAQLSSFMSMTEVKPTEAEQQQQQPVNKTTVETPVNTTTQREAPYLKDVDNKTKAPVQVENTEVISDYKKAYEDIKSKYESEIPTLKSQLDEHAKTLEQIKVEKRRIEVASVIPPHISEFKDKNGNFSSQKYNETIEALAAKSYDVADLAKLYGKIAELEDQVITPKAVANSPKAVYGSSSSSVEAASTTSQDQAAIIKTPKLESVESASTANFGSSLVKSVPINGKRKGRIA